MQTITQQTKDGKTVEYRICDSLDKIYIDVYVGGKRHTTGQPVDKTEIVQGRQVYGHINAVYVSNPDTWAEIMTAYTSTKEQLELTDEYKTQQLRQQRERLSRALGLAQDELYGAENRKVESAMQGRSYRYDANKLQFEISAAKADLKAFDEAHPEIIAGVRKEQDERTERNMWN